MENLLIRLAEQLDGLDEASLMALWPKYAQLAYEFQGTKKWETAALVLCLIQAKHMKNQLFNYHWRQQAGSQDARRGPLSSQEAPRRSDATPCRILQFEPLGQSKDKK